MKLITIEEVVNGWVVNYMEEKQDKLGKYWKTKKEVFTDRDELLDFTKHYLKGSNAFVRRVV